MSHLTLEGYQGSIYCPVGTDTAAIVGPKLPDVASVQVGAVVGKIEAYFAPRSNRRDQVRPSTAGWTATSAFILG